LQQLFFILGILIWKSDKEIYEQRIIRTEKTDNPWFYG